MTSFSFRGGSGPIHLDNVQCSGSESRLLNCPYDSHTLDCSHAEDAGVLCRPSEGLDYIMITDYDCRINFVACNNIQHIYIYMYVLN